MSGIAGIVHFRGPPPDRSHAEPLASALAHRGPQGRAFMAEGPVVLVQCGLPPTHHKHDEPALARSADTVMAIDAFLAAGEQALVETWEQQGPEGLSEVDGAFAFAAWNTADQTLTLVRDPCGSRPLFYARSGSRVAFASEIAPLLALPWVDRALATNHIAELLSFRYVHAPRTLYRDVFAVPPGHALRIDASGQRARQWWQPHWAPPREPPPTHEEDIAHSVDTALNRAVTRALVGDAATGVLLSGGLDSSAILYHACALGPAPRSFTVGFAEDPLDESPFAARVARVMGSEHTLVRLSSEAFIAGLHAATRAMGAPLPTGAAVLQHLLFQQVRTEVPVVLSGDGGDEVLGGRGMEKIAARLRRSRLVSSLPPPMRQIGRQAARAVGQPDLSVPPARFGLDRDIGGSQVFDGEDRATILRDPGMVRPGIRHALLEPYYQEVDTDPINAILHVWQRGWLPEDSLARSDRMSAHAGLDVRFPLLDRRMLQLSASIPGPIKVHRRGLGYVTKWPLRQVMKDRIPAQLLNRPKRSLPNPLDRWLRGQGAAFLGERIEALCTDPDRIFVPEGLRRLAREHLAGTRNHGLKLWTVILFGVWREVSR